MALQKCIECGHEVSTYADKCPNCGCPVSITKGVESEKYVDVILVDAGKNILNVIRFIRELSAPPLGLAEAKQIVENLPQVIIRSTSKSTGYSVVEKLAEIGCTARLELSTTQNTSSEVMNHNISADISSTYLFSKDTPARCPRCMSNQITTGSRGYSLLWGFLGSNKTVNRCGKCGYIWKP